MNWEQDDIRKNFHGVIRDARTMTEGELGQKYLKFKDRFPKLFEMAIESVATDTVQKNLGLFDMMMTKRQEQKDGTKTKTTTDMAVGNQLGKEFIYPKTNMPSQTDYNKAINKINKGTALKELEKTL